MRTIARAHASTRATSSIHVENSTHHLDLSLIVWDIGTKKMKTKTKTSNVIVDRFSLTFVNLSLT